MGESFAWFRKAMRAAGMRSSSDDLPGSQKSSVRTDRGVQRSPDEEEVFAAEGEMLASLYDMSNSPAQAARLFEMNRQSAQRHREHFMDRLNATESAEKMADNFLVRMTMTSLRKLLQEKSSSLYPSSVEARLVAVKVIKSIKEDPDEFKLALRIHDPSISWGGAQSEVYIDLERLINQRLLDQLASIGEK